MHKTANIVKKVNKWNEKYRLQAYHDIRRYDTGGQSQYYAADDLGETMSEHRLEVLRGELPLPVDIRQDTAPFVDYLGLLARFPADSHRIVDDDRREHDGDGELRCSEPLCHGDARDQGDDRGGMRRRHAPGGEEEFEIEFMVNQQMDERLERLCDQCAEESRDQRSV